MIWLITYQSNQIAFYRIFWLCKIICVLWNVDDLHFLLGVIQSTSSIEPPFSLTARKFYDDGLKKFILITHLSQIFNKKKFLRKNFCMSFWFLNRGPSSPSLATRVPSAVNSKYVELEFWILVGIEPTLSQQSVTDIRSVV